jgi:hypothetical protein
MHDIAKHSSKRKHSFIKFGKTEKEAFKALGHLPKFPKNLDSVKNRSFHS